MKELWKQIKMDYHFTEGLDAPLIIRYCNKHQRLEWYDPCNRWGGVAYSLNSLKNSLRTLYRCGNCGSYHVFDLVIIAEDKITFLSFIDFISK